MGPKKIDFTGNEVFKDKKLKGMLRLTERVGLLYATRYDIQNNSVLENHFGQVQPPCRERGQSSPGQAKPAMGDPPLESRARRGAAVHAEVVENDLETQRCHVQPAEGDLSAESVREGRLEVEADPAVEPRPNHRCRNRDDHRREHERDQQEPAPDPLRTRPARAWLSHFGPPTGDADGTTSSGL